MGLVNHPDCLLGQPGALFPIAGGSGISATEVQGDLPNPPDLLYCIFDDRGN